MKKLTNNIIVLLIQFYQNTLSKVFPPACKFNPSCSNYMMDAIRKYGSIKGVYLGLGRILKCHPFSKFSGWDPVK